MLRVFCVEVLVLVIHTSILVMLMLEVTVGRVERAASYWSRKYWLRKKWRFSS